MDLLDALKFLREMFDPTGFLPHPVAEVYAQGQAFEGGDPPSPEMMERARAQVQTWKKLDQVDALIDRLEKQRERVSVRFDELPATEEGIKAAFAQVKQESEILTAAAALGLSYPAMLQISILSLVLENTRVSDALSKIIADHPKMLSYIPEVSVSLDPRDFD